MFYVYVLKSDSDKKIYIGHTHNLIERLKQHNKGLVKSTHLRKPFSLLYYEASNLLQDATHREKMLKTGFGRAYLKRRLTDLKN